MTTVYTLRASWDETTQLWVATSAEIPGFLGVARTMNKLNAVLKQTVPKMLREKGLIHQHRDRVPFNVVVEH